MSVPRSQWPNRPSEIKSRAPSFPREPGTRKLKLPHARPIVSSRWGGAEETDRQRQTDRQTSCLVRYTVQACRRPCSQSAAACLVSTPTRHRRRRQRFWPPRRRSARPSSSPPPSRNRPDRAGGPPGLVSPVQPMQSRECGQASRTARDC